MLKRIVLVTALGVALMAPAAAQAQETAPAQKSPRLTARPFKSGVLQSLRAGRLSADQQKQLKADIQAFREQARTLRKAGKPLTTEQRQQLQAARQKLRQEIRSLVGKRPRSRTRKGTPTGGEAV